MKQVVEAALRLWGLESARWHRFAHRENTIYRVEAGTDCFALRLHRPSYRTDAQLKSELDWMAGIADAVSVPAPLPSAHGEFLHRVEGVQVDVLHWLDGGMLVNQMAEPGTDRAGLFHRLGAAAARLHLASDAWSPPQDFDRPDWNAEGLAGEAPVWGRFWENPWLPESTRTLFEAFREVASTHLGQVSLDHGLIHADLLGENVLVDGADLRFIDFDDGGFGYRLFELATALVRQLDAPDYPALRSAIFDGYQSVRPLDTSAFDLILALRATTYVGWIADRPDLPDAEDRQARNAVLAERLIRGYLDR